MIELRWVKSGGRRILQYRVLKYHVDASGAVNVLPAPVEWTAWVTVPEVPDEDQMR